MRSPSLVIAMRIWSLNARSAGVFSMSAVSFCFSCCRRWLSSAAMAARATDGGTECGWLLVASPGRELDRSRPPPSMTLEREAPLPSLPPNTAESGVLK